MQPSASPPKAIPPARDRLQSRLLVWLGIPVLFFLSYQAIRFANNDGHSGHVYLSMAIAVSTLFALVAWRMKAATLSAAACGGMICFLITEYSQMGNGYSMLHSGFTPLLLLFILTFAATRLGRARKAADGLAESRKGRNAAQIIANLLVAALFSTVLGAYIVDRASGRFGSDMDTDAYDAIAGLFLLPMLAALAEATADTVSSEIGQAFGGPPFLLTTLRRVPPGTDGAISLYGTLAGIAAAAIIAITGAPALGMSYAECAVAFIAGIGGLFFDSLLGATLERKGWLGNDLVNFASTAFAAALSLIAIRLGQSYLLR